MPRSSYVAGGIISRCPYFAVVLITLSRKAPEGATLPEIDYSFAGYVGRLPNQFCTAGLQLAICMRIPAMAAREDRGGSFRYSVCLIRC